ncbi:sugar transporter-like protein [Mrakia frigida]|uniref:sugar transporter-like protein n=1 Tax=Mrakia frigida TaxID=29902 RepID=UPI003FCC2199
MSTNSYDTPDSPQQHSNKSLSAHRDVKSTDSRVDQLRVEEGTLIKGLRYEDLNLYEKKSILINKEFDRQNAESGFWGLGRYQWCVFFLCGFGYFLDLCWAQAFGLIAGALQAELGVPNNQIGNLFTAFAAGLTVGALFWGLSVDIIGRRWCFNLTCIISSVFGLIFAGPSNFNGLCFIASMIGFGVGGNIPIDATITLEFLPTNRRFLLAALSFFQPVGVVVASVIGFGLIPNNSCDTALPARYLFIVLGCITLAVFLLRFVVFRFQESPKFLLAKGRDEEAIDVVHHIAAFNRAPAPLLTIEDFRALDASMKDTTSTSSSGLDASAQDQPHKTVVQRFLGELKHLKGLFRSKRMIWLFASMAVAYMALFWSFSIAGGEKGISTEVSLRQTYLNYIYVYLPGTVATLMAAGMLEIPKLGRNLAAFVGFNAMEYFFQSAYAAALYAYTPEAFPAPIRGSACGILSTLGRLSSTVAPIAAQSIFNPASNGVLYMAGGGAFLSAVAIITLPFDTRGKHTF